MSNSQVKAGSGRKNGPTRRMPSAERRVQLLKTAREIILRDGVGALTMTALADAVGVAKPIVYKHFENSEAVVIEILREFNKGSIAVAAERVKGSRTIYEFLDGVIESLFDYIKAEGDIVRNITNGFSSSNNVDVFFQRQRKKSHRIYCHLLLQQGVPEKIASVASYALIEMITMTIPEYAQTSDATDREVLKKMVRGALQGIVNGPDVKPRVPISLLDAEDDA